MKKLLLPLGLAAVTLSACTPVQVGSQHYAPIIQNDPENVTKVARGSTVYVQYTYSRRSVGLPKERFDQLKINFEAAGYSNNIIGPEADAGWLRMGSTNLPKGLEVSLVRATIAKPISETNKSYTGGSVEVLYTEVVRVLLKVTASADAPIGAYNVALTFMDDKTGPQVDLPISIQK